MQAQPNRTDRASTWGTISVGEGRLQVRHFMLWLGIGLWLLPTFLATGVHGIAWFAFNLSFLAVLIFFTSTVRSLPLHKMAICFLAGGLMTAPVLLIEMALVAVLGPTFPVRHFLTVPMEEVAKIAVVVFLLWRGRHFSTYTLGATDVLLMGAATGAGFAFVEDSFLHFMQPAPLSNLSVLLPASELIAGRVVCGHAVWTALAAGAIGLALLFGHKKEILLPFGIAGLAVACIDHIAQNYAGYSGALEWLRNGLNAITGSGYVALYTFLIVIAFCIVIDTIVTLGTLPKAREFKFPRRKDRKEPITSLWDSIMDLRRLNYAFFRYRQWDAEQVPTDLALTVALLAKRLVNRYLASDNMLAITPRMMGNLDPSRIDQMMQQALPAGDIEKKEGGISPFDKRPLKELLDLPPRYQIEEEMFRGGMGIILRARHQQTRAALAVKVLHPHLADNSAILLRFKQEAKASSHLKHPNIVTVHDFGVTPNKVAFLVMEWLDGTSLERVVKLTGPMSGFRFTNIFIQAANALSHAHRNGVVHRDIKPSNIILTKADNTADNVKIVDFGIAKIVSEEEDTGGQLGLTSTGDVMGSPYFMSPEQCSGGHVDHRSDIYSLGCVMYETLCGRPPLTGANPAQVYHKHLHEMPKQPRSINPNINRPELFEPMLFKCLQKDPDKRYQTMDELEQDLKVINDTLRRG